MELPLSCPACGLSTDRSTRSGCGSTVAELKEQLGDDKVILGLSGGVDSSVAAVLLNKAIGKNLPRIPGILFSWVLRTQLWLQFLALEL